MPAQTRQEILDAARALLWEQPFRELTVGGLMAQTSVGRSAFYVHFRDLYGLAAALLESIDAELERATRVGRRGPNFPGGLADTLKKVVEVWTRHGPVIRAISEASTQDERLDAVYRNGFVQGMIDRVRTAICDAQRDGRLDPSLDAAELATLLVLMNERYLGDRLGRIAQADAVVPCQMVVMAWERILR